MIKILLISFLIGGGVYVWMEVMLDRTSHWFMGVAGGTVFIIGRLLLMTDLHWILFALLISLVIMIVELLSGLLINRNHDVWDYRKYKYHFMGQICLRFYFIWLIVMPPVIIAIDSILPRVK